MDSILEILSNTSLFGGLDDDQLKKTKRIAIGRKYKKGQIIFSEGDDGVGFYVVVNGSVKIYKASADGKEKILHIFGPGEPFGEVSMFTGKSFPANAEAITKAQLLFFPKSAFVDLITSNPSISLNMLAVLCMRLRLFAVQIENISLKAVPGRLASYLLFLADEQGVEKEVTLTISKGQLASLLGTIPETLSRVLTKLSGQQIIEVNGRAIKLIDREELKALSENGKLLE
jgi:CRP/FNR family transcriptional regulator